MESWNIFKVIPVGRKWEGEKSCLDSTLILLYFSTMDIQNSGTVLKHTTRYQGTK